MRDSSAGRPFAFCFSRLTLQIGSDPTLLVTASSPNGVLLLDAAAQNVKKSVRLDKEFLHRARCRNLGTVFGRDPAPMLSARGFMAVPANREKSTAHPVIEKAGRRSPGTVATFSRKLHRTTLRQRSAGRRGALCARGPGDACGASLRLYGGARGWSAKDPLRNRQARSFRRQQFGDGGRDRQ